MRPDRVYWLRTRLAAGVLATAAVAALLATGLTWRVDTWIHDSLMAAFAPQADERIVLVAIDERSLSALGRWPWPRGIHATLIDRLAEAGARGIVLNTLFAEPAHDDTDGDAQLAEAMARSGNVILPMLGESSEAGGLPIEVLPMTPLVEAAAGLGHVDAGIDRDGVARHAYLRAGIGAPHWPALALALLDEDTQARPPGIGSPHAPGASPYQWVRDHQILVPHTAPGAFPTLSFLDVLRGDVDDAVLQGRWILVGVTAAGLDHGLLTPLARSGERVPSIEYHANVLNALVRAQIVVPFTAWQQWLLSIALVLLPVALYGERSAWRRAWAVSLLSAALTLLLCVLLLRYGHYWFDPTPTLAVLLGAYVAWTLYHLRHSQRQALSDALTLLANRRMFDLTLQRELAAARRIGRPLSLLLIDVDHFKHFNDRYGHLAGDDALRRVARVLLLHVRRPRDLAARYGGDELAAILPETPAPAARAIAEAIVGDVRALQIPHEDSGVAPWITLSVGVAVFDPRREPGEIDLLQRADAALYRAKHEGRDRSHVTPEQAATR